MGIRISYIENPSAVVNYNKLQNNINQITFLVSNSATTISFRNKNGQIIFHFKNILAHFFLS